VSLPQKQIVQRYLTKNPKLEASKELKQIVETLTRIDEYTFTLTLKEWHKKWHDFLKEKTIHSITERWSYTHKKLRFAYRSLNTNLPYLFTYQQYPHLHIPNTTNSKDFSHTSKVYSMFTEDLFKKEK